MKRLEQVATKQGAQAAINFAKQTKYVYWSARKDAKKKGRGYGKEYRLELVNSLIVLRRFLHSYAQISSLFDMPRVLQKFGDS